MTSKSQKFVSILKRLQVERNLTCHNDIRMAFLREGDSMHEYILSLVPHEAHTQFMGLTPHDAVDEILRLTRVQGVDQVIRNYGRPLSEHLMASLSEAYNAPVPKPQSQARRLLLTT